MQYLNEFHFKYVQFIILKYTEKINLILDTECIFQKSTKQEECILFQWNVLKY